MNAEGSFVERAIFSCNQEIISFLVRKGHVWMKLQTKNLCYASPSQPFSCAHLPILGYSYLEVVSEQGNYCFTILTVGPTVLEAVSGQVHRISLPNFPATREKVGAWMTTSMSNKPILFIAHKSGKVCKIRILRSRRKRSWLPPNRRYGGRRTCYHASCSIIRQSDSSLSPYFTWLAIDLRQT